MSEVNKIANYNQMMSWLTRPATPKTQVVDLVDDLEPGSLKDELLKDFDPSQETHEEYLQRKNLDRPFNAQNGGRANLAIGGGSIVGKNLETREGFNEPYAVQKISKLGGEPFERVYTKKPGKKIVYDVDEEALKNEWRKTLSKKDPVPWKNFLEKKFPEGAEAIRKRIEAKKNFFPAKEFSVVGDKKRQDRLAEIEKLKEAHQKSDKFLYDAKSVSKKLKINLTRKDHAAELDLIDTFDSREDKIRKAFDKITSGNMKLYKPKRTASGNITAMNPVYKIISDIVSNPELSARYSTDARIINKALENHQPYLDIKDDFDYFAQNESSNFIGQNFKDGLEYAKYKRGGLDIKNTGNFSKVYALPEKNVVEFAIRNAYVNFKRGNIVDPKEAVELFYLKKDGTQGDPVDFNDLPRDKKSRARILNSDKIGFTYKGEFYNKKNVKTKGYKSDGSGVFNEVYEMSQKGRTLVPDPNSSTGEQITLKQLLGDTGDKLTIGHNDAKGGVAGSPFTDLRLEGAKFNASIFQAYDKVKDPKAREMIINNLQGKFKDLSGPKYEKAFIESKSQLAKDVFNNPEATSQLPTYYRGAGQKVLADMGKDFFSQSDDFKKEVSRVADIDLDEYEANKSKYKKNLILQLSKKNNLPPEMVEEDLTNVQKVLRKMQGQMNSGMDPKLLVEYLGAEVKDLAAFGSKYGGDVLGKVGKGITGIDLPIFQTMFGAMYDLEQDSPVWLTLPAAFTDEVANVFKLYDKSTGKYGLGKAKDFGKFVASSFVPRFMRSPIFKAVSKVGKAGSMAAPVLELGKQAYLNEKRKGMLPDIARQFDIPIEEAKRGYDNFVRQSQIRGMQSMVDDTEIPEMSQQGQNNLNSLINSFKQLGSLVGVSEDPYAEKESIYTRGKENPMSLDRALYPNRQNFADGPEDPSKKGLGSLSKRQFLKILSLIPAGILAVRGGPNFLNKAKKTTTAVTKSFEGAPAYFINLYKKIKSLGKDATQRQATQDREVVTEFEDYILTEDLATGRTTIQKTKIDGDHQYYDENLAEQTYMDFIPGAGQADETTGNVKIPNEYVEDTSYLRTSGPQKGEIYDTVDGVPDDVIQDGTKFEDDFMDFEPKKKNDK